MKKNISIQPEETLLKEKILAAKKAMGLGDWGGSEKLWLEALSMNDGSRHHPLLRQFENATEAMTKWKEPRHCNLCGCPFFCHRGTREAVNCLNCRSLERTRALFLHMQKFSLLRPGLRILHIAPERGLHEKIRLAAGGDNYLVADLDPSRYRFAGQVSSFDLCRDAAKLPDAAFDLIIHSHVIEHIRCAYAPVLRHLHRALKEDGTHLCVIPFAKGHYDESMTPPPPEEAVRRFGQSNHVRRFGVEDIDRTLGRVLRLDKDYNLLRLFTEQELLEANIPQECWAGLTQHTVLRLKRNDCLIL